MTVNITTNAEIDSIRMTQQTAHPSSPTSGYEQLYIISGSSHGGLFVKDSSGRQIGPFITGSAPVGSVLVQKVGYESGAVSSGTQQIPLDDSIPQNTEGDQPPNFQLEITPTSATNILYITVTIFVNHSATGAWRIVALFQDSTASAIAAIIGHVQTAGAGIPLTFTHKMIAGTTSATTFKVRVGANVGGTTTINGIAGARYMGGVMASSITIEEVTP